MKLAPRLLGGCLWAGAPRRRLQRRGSPLHGSEERRDPPLPPLNSPSLPPHWLPCPPAALPPPPPPPPPKRDADGPTTKMLMSRLLDFQKTRYARFMNHRVPPNRRYQPTEYEHAANCATHAFWIIPSILGSSILHVLSDNQWETISAWIYGFGLSGLFIVSTIFHTVSWKKRHLRTVEHCLHMFDRMVIYFFIAASYAPWLNLRELGPWASHMRWIVWIMASIGTVYVFFFHERRGGRHLSVCRLVGLAELIATCKEESGQGGTSWWNWYATSSWVSSLRWSFFPCLTRTASRS
ncbi:monocyte to macrophage differentiation factor 2 isoform X3 [Hemicordylus capensis]|uniref:monocyte to macrophage differentiation factor 2 isoform X3 n=1 Tax=Hemicordylus capensis TaxID=884348 RepID=UPI002302B785|nr:monocyte to macrophage differentiation factor 2 isoform X3 [Hemicordylus capensis]